VPFLLAGVILNPDMNGPDGVHPNAAGARRIANTVWPYLEALVRHVSATAYPSDSSGGHAENVIGDYEFAISTRIVRPWAGESADNLRNRDWQDRCSALTKARRPRPRRLRRADLSGPPHRRR
jgi:hypothetical protein